MNDIVSEAVTSVGLVRFPDYDTYWILKEVR